MSWVVVVVVAIIPFFSALLISFLLSLFVFETRAGRRRTLTFLFPFLYVARSETGHHIRSLRIINAEAIYAEVHTVLHFLPPLRFLRRLSFAWAA